MFDIQRFGSNDIVTTSIELKLELIFEDNDSRTITVQNPRSNVTKAEVEAVSQTLLDTQAFVGDKKGSPFSHVGSAYIISRTRRKLDLS